jgi:ankyrin repeat protein
MEAAWYNHESIVSLLIDRGADINSKDNDGETALDIAKNKNYSNIVSIIQNKLKIEAEVNMHFIISL